jgi:hypothetical protein
VIGGHGAPGIIASSAVAADAEITRATEILLSILFLLSKKRGVRIILTLPFMYNL